MRLLIGEDTNSTLESTEYVIDGCNNNLIPNYVYPSERQEWVNLQEQIRLFQEADHPNNIKKNTTNGKINWQALLLHVLNLSGHIHQECNKIHDVPYLSHKSSKTIMDADIGPYRYDREAINNTLYSNTEPTVASFSKTYGEDEYYEEVEEYTDIINKEGDSIYSLALDEERQETSGSSSYIEVDQELTMPIVVATSTSLMSTGWKYCLGGLGIVLGGVGLYSGYKWLMSSTIAASEEKEILIVAMQDDTPQTAMQMQNMNFEQGMLYLQKHRPIPEPESDAFQITLNDLQYDHITNKDSKLGLYDIITSTISRDFYNKYFYLILKEVQSGGVKINDYNQFIIQVHTHILNEIQAITQSHALMKLGPCEYLYKLIDIADTIRIKSHISLMDNDFFLINGIYSDWDNMYIKNYTIYAINPLLDEIKTYYKSIINWKSGNAIKVPKPIESIISFISNNIILLGQQYKNESKKFERAVDSFAFDIYYLNQAFLKENGLDIAYYKIHYSQMLFKLVLAGRKTEVSERIVSTLLLYYKVLPKIFGHQLLKYKEITQPKNIYHSTTLNYESEVMEDGNNDEQELKRVGKQDTGVIVDSIIGIGAVAGSAGGSILVGSKIIKGIQLGASIQNVDLKLPEVENHGITLDVPLTTNRISEADTTTVRYTSPAPAIASCTLSNVLNQFIDIMPKNIVKSQSLILQERSNFLEQEFHQHPWKLYLDIASNDVPPYIQATYQDVLIHLKELKEMYNHVCNVLNEDNAVNNQYVRRYISDSLDITSELAIKKAIDHIKQAACNGYSYIVDSAKKNFNNIVIASTQQIPIQDDEGVKYITTLRPDEIVDCPLAFTIPGSIEINIIADQGYYITPQYHIEYYRNNNIDLLETLLHEISHITSDAVDFFYIPVVKTGGLPNAKDALDFIKNILESGDPISNNLTLLINQYIRQCELPQPQFLQDAVFNLFSNDQMLRANIQCMNADNIAIYIRDIYERRPYDRLVL